MDAGIQVEVVYALPDRQALIALTVPEGTSLLEVARRSGIASWFPESRLEEMAMGVFGKRVSDPASRTVRAGDRVEIYRPLSIDPKAARRARAERTRDAD